MDNYLMHYGIKGQKWGVRRYQNPDGSLTIEGKERYSLTPHSRSWRHQQDLDRRADVDADYRRLKKYNKKLKKSHEITKEKYKQNKRDLAAEYKNEMRKVTKEYIDQYGARDYKKYNGSEKLMIGSSVATALAGSGLTLAGLVSKSDTAKALGGAMLSVSPSLAIGAVASKKTRDRNVRRLKKQGIYD